MGQVILIITHASLLLTTSLFLLFSPIPRGNLLLHPPGPLQVGYMGHTLLGVEPDNINDDSVMNDTDSYRFRGENGGETGLARNSHGHGMHCFSGPWQVIDDARSPRIPI